jgi:hypothetical protein
VTPAIAMEGDGPPARDPYSDDEVTLGEIIATCDDCADILGALSFSRGWTEDVPRSWLAPWQQVGPDILWAVSRQTEAEIHRIGPVVTRHVAGLGWVLKKRLSRLQVELAVSDALDRLIYGECMSADVSALMVACRKETFLDLRAEAVAFMAFAMSMAECRLRDQLREPRTPR